MFLIQRCMRGLLAALACCLALIAATGASWADHVVINFDDLPQQGATGVMVTDQYPSVTFSSTPGNANYVTTQNQYNGSKPNFICTGHCDGAIDCVEETILDFSQPVNNLTFNGLGINNNGPVAKIDVYVNDTLEATIPVIGHAKVYDPELQDLSAYKNVTRIRIYAITDAAGIGWDDFTFDTSSSPPPDMALNQAQIDRWFNTGLTRGDGTAVAVHGNNIVKEFIDGPDTFKEMVRVIRTATGPGHFVYMLNWWMSDDFLLVPADPNSRLDKLLSDASKAGVEVRAMLWDQTGTQNSNEVKHISQLVSGAAILDNRTLNYGSHHQKILIVKGSEGIVAFCGGIDFNEDRIAALARQAGSPMHDVHCRIQGPAASDLLKTFIERWNDHPSVKKLPAKKRGLLGAAIALPLPGAGGTNFVQIGRTFGNGVAHAGIGGIRPFTSGYTFAPNGERTARQMFLQAISQAQKFIYIEDQYLVSMDASRALLAALPNITHLTILIPHGSISDLPQGNYRRQQFIAPLKKWDKDHCTNKVRIFYLKPPGGPHTYIHSKTWIVDDEFAIIGSANCNRRSWTHDSEVIAGICDQGNGQGRRFAHQLRMKLWAEHLGIPYDPDEMKLLSGIGSAALWLKPPGGAKIAPYDENADIETVHTDTAWNNFEDPDGS